MGETVPALAPEGPRLNPRYARPGASQTPAGQGRNNTTWPPSATTTSSEKTGSHGLSALLPSLCRLQADCMTSDDCHLTLPYAPQSACPIALSSSRLPLPTFACSPRPCLSSPQLASPLIPSLLAPMATPPRAFSLAWATLGTVSRESSVTGPSSGHSDTSRDPSAIDTTVATGAN